MKKRIGLSSITIIIANGVFAQAKIDTVLSSEIISLIALLVAIVALVLAVLNAYNISHNRKIRDVNLVNQKDDINVTMDAIKLTLSKDIRGLKRDLNKMERGPKPKNSRTEQNALEEGSDTLTTEQPKAKKPFKKRRPFRRKPAVKDENKGE